MPLPGTTISVPDLPAAGPENGYCQFPVLVKATTNSQPAPPSSATHFAGGASATVTRLDTGKTIKFNISGPGTVIFADDGSFTIDAGGPNLLWTTVKNSLPGVPKLNYTTGHVHVEVGADQVTDVFELSGRSTDVCALLA
jgi:hypothetical protein